MNTEKSPKVTVLMSAYNAEKYIREAIDSILNQTFEDFEYIIFDDGSDDSTPKIIAEYEKKDKRVKAFYNKENHGMEGMVVNLNKGMKTARGKYIARMDSDDISMPERLGKEVKFLDASPDIFLVGTGAVNIDPDGKTLSEFSPITNPVQLKVRMEKVPSIYNPTVMFRTGTGLEYRALRTCEDYNFFMQALKKGLKLANIPGKLLKYRIIPPSLSHVEPYVRTMNTVAVQDLYFGRLDEGNLNQDYINDNYDPQKCSAELLRRMVELAYLSRSYDVLFDIASLYTSRFGMDLTFMSWEAISGLKLLIKRLL